MIRKSLQRSIAAVSETQLNNAVFELEKRKEFYEYI